MSSTRKMPGIGFHLVCLACLCLATSPSLVGAAGLYDWMSEPTACTSQNAPSSSTGPQPSLPQWPQGYSLNIEANMKQGDWGYDAEEHFDNSSKMASVRTTVSGDTQQTIFSTDPLERYTIVNEDSCIASTGGRDFHPLPFASMSQSSVDPSKISFGQLFQFGSKSDGGFIYVGQSVVRGIQVNQWTACQEWTDMSAKVQIDFYFSTPGYKSPWGQEEVPVRAEVKGTTGLFNTAYIPKSYEIENVYDLKSFKSGPSHSPDQGVFQVPMKVVCVGRSDNKAMPDLPDSFEMDIELSAPHLGSSVPLVTSLRYDWNNQILESVREFVVPLGRTGDKGRHKPKSFFEDKKNKKNAQTDWVVVKTMSTVEDYHTGIQYITEKVNNSCMMRHIPDSTSMTHGNMIMRLYKDQKHGLSDMTYQGRSILRGVPVESWGMDKDGIVQKVFFMSRQKGATDIDEDTSDMTEEERHTFEFGISKLQFNYLNTYPVLLGIVVRNRTSASNKNFPVLIKDLLADGVFTWYGDRLKMIQDKNPELLVTDDLVYKYLSWTRMQDMQTEHVGEIDVFVHHFQPLHMGGDLFHVSQCYKSEEIAKVMITVDAPFEESVRHSLTAFLNPLRSSIAQAIGVSIVQISDIQAAPLVNSKKNIDATLVTFNLLGSPSMEENKIEQQDLKISKKRIVAAVHSGITFKVKYAHEIKSFTVGDNLFRYSKKVYPIIEAASSDDDDDKSYSGGVVAGVAVAVFVATCLIFGVIFLVHFKTRRPDSSISVPYHVVTNE